MKRLLPIFYVAAITLHAAVIFGYKPSPPLPPKLIEKTFIEVALTAPPPEPQKVVTPPPVIPPPKAEPPPEPKPEIKPEPIPPAPEPVMTIPEPKPEPPPLPPPVAPPVIAPPPTEYVVVAEPKYAARSEPIYPVEARRRHQQGIVRLELFISERGALDKVEVVKSSGFPLLDAAAMKAMRQSQFEAAMNGALRIRSRAEATVTFRLE